MLNKLQSEFKKKSWLYSIISLLNVGCGLSVTALIWYNYAATKESDIILLATSSISILAQLSLVGVEQVLYFYADERKNSHQGAHHFFKLAFTWSLISGAIFALIFISLSKYFLLMVASGFSEEAKMASTRLLVSLSPQLVLSPALHVLRAKWALDEKFGRAYLLSAVNSVILLICLTTMTVIGITDISTFGNLSAAVFTVFVFSFVIYNRQFLVKLSRSDWLKIKDLVVHSSAIKGANSVHNFLVQALISSILSRMPTGSISVFQYAKKLADGVFAITAGPQVMIYHSKCATWVSDLNLVELKHNVAHFLKTFLSLFFVMGLVVYAATPLALSFVAKSFSPQTVQEIRAVYVGIVIWYLIMGIETLSVGVILATRSSFALFAVNFSFILLFFTWSQIHPIENILELTFTTVGFQAVSFCLFTLFAAIVIRRRWVARAS